jgi:hypothetical protein
MAGQPLHSPPRRASPRPIDSQPPIGPKPAHPMRVFLPADNRIDFARFLTADISEIQVSLGTGAWIEVVGGKTLVASAAHAPGPPAPA